MALAIGSVAAQETGRANATSSWPRGGARRAGGRPLPSAPLREFAQPVATMRPVERRGEPAEPLHADDRDQAVGMHAPDGATGLQVLQVFKPHGPNSSSCGVAVRPFGNSVMRLVGTIRACAPADARLPEIPVGLDAPSRTPGTSRTTSRHEWPSSP